LDSIVNAVLDQPKDELQAAEQAEDKLKIGRKPAAVESGRRSDGLPSAARRTETQRGPRVDELAETINTSVDVLRKKLEELEAQVKVLNSSSQAVSIKVEEAKHQVNAHGTAIESLRRKVTADLAGIAGIYEKLKEGFKDSSKSYESLTKSVEQHTKSVERTQEIEVNLATEFEAAKKASEIQAAALDKLSEEQAKSVQTLGTVETAVNKQAKAISGLEGESRAWYKALHDIGAQLLDQLRADFQRDSQERSKEIQQYRQQMDEARDRLITAQAKVEDEFRREFQELHRSYQTVQASLQQSSSPEGILQFLRAYQTVAAANLDESARAGMLERLPGLLRVVETELARWQLKLDGDSAEAFEVTRDGRVFLEGDPGAGEGEKVSPQEVELVTRVTVRTLETVQTRIIKWLKDCGLEHFPQPGEPYDASLHRVRKSVPTTNRADDHLIKRVLYSGFRLPGKKERLSEAWVDVWEYKTP
jgi:chromosome segregation ATPase